MTTLSPDLDDDERIELQVSFKILSSTALELLGTYRIHQHPFLVQQTVTLVEKAARWSVYLENDQVLLADAARFLRLYEITLGNVREQLTRGWGVADG